MGFPDSPRGDALYAMELSLALEKMNYEKLLEAHAAGEAAGDSQLVDFVESDFLEDQLNSIKEISDWVTQLRRVGDGQGEFPLRPEPHVSTLVVLPCPPFCPEVKSGCAFLGGFFLDAYELST